ncbi:MAG: cytochrome b6f subunit family protein [Thermosynechococcaceae cyanobacterium]
MGQVGIVQGYKMTDGSGIGIKVKFDNQTATWFFEDEVELVQ